MHDDVEMEQIEVIDVVVKYLSKNGWCELFSNRPGNNHAAHGFVVPIKGKVVDAALFKNRMLMLLEADSKISFKDKYHTKLFDLKEYLSQDDHLKTWVKETERRNGIKMGEINQIVLALAYYEMDFRMNLIKPNLAFKGFHLYRVTLKGKVIEEHKIIPTRINHFLSE